MEFIEKMKEKAKQNIKTIVLPEATELRILKATEEILKDNIANIILLGNPDEILQKAAENNIDISKASIINPKTSNKHEEYSNFLYELRKEKGMTIEKAKELVLDEIHYGMLMLKCEDADGLVCGAVHSTADTLRPALQILKTTPDTKIVSAFFIMDIKNYEYGQVYLMADCGINVSPNSEELAEIAIASAKSFETLVGETPKIAMLSHSTHGSATSEYTQKVIDATNIVKTRHPELIVEGEVQADAAIVPEVAKIKTPDSGFDGHCNVLVFPTLDAGNIGYKLVQRFAHAEAYGPLCQGIAKPINDLSRGCNVNEIVGVIAITAVQARENNVGAGPVSAQVPCTSA